MRKRKKKLKSKVLKRKSKTTFIRISGSHSSIQLKLKKLDSLIFLLFHLYISIFPLGIFPLVPLKLVKNGLRLFVNSLKLILQIGDSLVHLLNFKVFKVFFRLKFIDSGFMLLNRPVSFNRFTIFFWGLNHSLLLDYTFAVHQLSFIVLN